MRHGGRWLVDESLSAGCPVAEALDLGADTVYVFTMATAPRRRRPRGAVAMVMNSVSLVTAKMQRAQLEEAQRRATQRGGAVWVVPSREPEAPSPFDFRQSEALATAVYDRARNWLVNHVKLMYSEPRVLRRPSSVEAV